MDNRFATVMFTRPTGGDMLLAYARRIDPARINVLAALALLPDSAFAVTVSRVAQFPVPLELISEQDRSGLEALYEEIKGYFDDKIVEFPPVTDSLPCTPAR